MNVLLLILGLLLVLLSLIDALWTALWVDGGAGPVTNQITNGVWWVMIKLIRTKRNHRLSLAGPMIQTVTVFVWVGLLWAGWLLMFSADSTSLVYARTPEPQPGNLIDRIYFCGLHHFYYGQRRHLSQSGRLGDCSFVCPP